MGFAFALELAAPEEAFLLGLCASLGARGLASLFHDESLREVQEEYRARFGNACVIDWPSDAESGIVLRAVGAGAVEISREREREFVQGVLAGLVRPSVDRGGVPHLEVASAEVAYLDYLLSALGLPPLEGGVFKGVAAVDALGRILEGAPKAVPALREFLDQITTHVTHLNPPPVRAPSVQPDPTAADSTQSASTRAELGSTASTDTASRRSAAMLVQLVHPDARLPKKEHISDSGYDLTLLYEKKRFGKTILFGTGVIVEPPFGWYFDVVPRSSIIKLGYILANSVGVIDRSYRGEIFVPLIKIDEGAPDLELPARVAQLIPRPIVHFPVEHEENLTRTTRGSGGFGSTGK